MSKWRDGRVPRQVPETVEYHEGKRRMGMHAYFPTFTVQVPGFEPEAFLAPEKFARKIWEAPERDEAAIESWWNGSAQNRRNEALKELKIIGRKQVKRQAWHELQGWVRQELLRLKRQDDRPRFARELAVLALCEV